MSLTDQQYDEIMGIYYENQLNNKEEERNRKAEIYEKIPEIEAIDSELASASVAAARNKLLGNDVSIEAAKKENASRIKRKESLLVQNGYPVDYLKPIYTCPLCQDTGRTENGYCICFQQAQLKYLYSQSTIENNLAMDNFDTFSLAYYSKENDGVHPITPYDNMEYIYNETLDFVKNFDENGGNLFFYGGTGLGKTFLSNCIAKYLLDRNHTVLYQSAIHLFEICADVIMNKNNNPNSKKLYQYIFDCDLLIIDDLGTESKTSFITSEVYDILNTRLREHKPTVISCNLTLKEISQRYSDRIVSRILSEYKAFQFYGDDIRILKKKTNM
ncbi:MAG: ATP-binding protein [Lachnospiraceae bacterium]